MPKVGKHIYKRKDGRWEGRYVTGHVNGRAKYGSVYGSSCKEVREKLDKAKQDAARKQIPVIKAGNVSEISSCWLASEGVLHRKVSEYPKMLYLASFRGFRAFGHY